LPGTQKEKLITLVSQVDFFSSCISNYLWNENSSLIV